MEEMHQQAAQALKLIWENKDLSLLRNSLSENIKWYERSYGKPLNNPETVVDQWKNDLAHQSDIKVSLEILAWQDQKGTYQFDASFGHGGGIIDMVGIFYVELDDTGKIALFKQWWMLKED